MYKSDHLEQDKVNFHHMHVLFSVRHVIWTLVYIVPPGRLNMEWNKFYTKCLLLKATLLITVTF